MSTATIITPVPDAQFAIGTLTEASTIIHQKRFLDLTDAHLSHVVIYDRPGAEAAYRQRDAERMNLAMRHEAAVKAAAAPAPPAQRTKKPADEIESWDELVQEYPNRPVTYKLFDEMMNIIVEMRKRLQGEIDTLTRRVAEAESAAAIGGTSKAAGGGVRWGGVFETGKSVAEGALVTCGGSLWLAKKDTSIRPGSDPASWVLIVKKGDYGRREPNE